jgi:hypothetical protein
MLLGTPPGGAYERLAYRFAHLPESSSCAYPLAAWLAEDPDRAPGLELALVLGTLDALGADARSATPLRALRAELDAHGARHVKIDTATWEVGDPTSMAGSLLDALAEHERAIRDASVLVDVTFGFRTQPMVLLESIDLIEQRFHATTEAIIYGRRLEGGGALLDDITELVRLRRLSQATTDAVHTGRYRSASSALEALARTHRASRVRTAAQRLQALDTFLQAAQASAAIAQARQAAAGLEALANDPDAPEALGVVARALRDALHQSPLLRHIDEAGPDDERAIVALLSQLAASGNVGIGLRAHGQPPEEAARRRLEELLRDREAAADPRSPETAALDAALLEPIRGPSAEHLDVEWLRERLNRSRDLRNRIAHAGWRNQEPNGSPPRSDRYHALLERQLDAVGMLVAQMQGRRWPA